MALAAEPWGDKFRRTVQLVLKDKLDEKEVQAHVAAYARSSLQELISQKRASPLFTRFVDGMQDAPEERVRINNGSIVYLFSHIYQAAIAGLEYAVNRSPQLSGDYRRGWFVGVDGEPWTRPLEEIPNSAQVMITNREPYHRKIDVGGQITSVPPGIVEDTRQMLQKRFPNLLVTREFVTISGGTDAKGGRVPYVLKGRPVESGLSYTRKEGWRRLRAPRASRRLDRQAGQTITYPAVVFSERTR